METILGGLAFALIMAAQLLAVVVVHNARCANAPASSADFVNEN